MSKSRTVFTLVTDFGHMDEYVAVMKGILLSHCPTSQIIDICHTIPPQNIKHGSHTLSHAFSYFPKGSIHLAVVDPGVGCNRDILIVTHSDYIFVAPDNGLLTGVLCRDSATRCYRVNADVYEGASNTFHGRDIMAPLAGRLGAGEEPTLFANEITAAECVSLPPPILLREKKKITGEVMIIDHFGNISSSIPASMLPKPYDGIQIHLKGRVISGICSTYANAEKGETLAVINSRGYLEISQNCGNASLTTGAEEGDRITLSLP